jgi:ribosomal protein L28
MGIDRAKRPDKPMTGPRIWLPLDVLQGDAYASLPLSAKALMLDLAAQLRAKYGEIINNGDLTTAFSVLSKRGWKDAKTIRSAAKKLEHVGLVIKTRQGQRPNLCNLYALTWLPLNESSKLEISARGFPLHAYKLLDKLPPFKIRV